MSGVLKQTSQKIRKFATDLVETEYLTSTLNIWE